MVTLNDIDIINGCAENDRYYQKLLYERYAKKMLAVCMVYTGDTYEAENVLQESFIKIFHHIKNYKPSGSLEGWIRRIIVNTATDYYRKKKRIKFSEVKLEDVHSDEAGSFDVDSFAVKDIVAAIQTLPEGCRMVFTLYAVEGYTHKEIGELLGISEGTSKSQYSRAKSLLKDKLKKNESISAERYNV